MLLATVYTAGAPLWWLLAGISDMAAGQARKRPRLRALGFFGLYLGAELVGVTLALAKGLVTLDGRIGGAARYVAWNAALQRGWTQTIYRGAIWLFGMRVKVEGAELAARGPMLLFVRHTSSADTLLSAVMVANPHHLLLRYVLKRELLWDPCLDVVGKRLPNAFVDRRSPRSQGEIDAVVSLTAGLDEQSAVLIYPEGTRFEPEKLVRSVEKLSELGLPHLAAIASRYERVLPPRLGGPLALLTAAPDVDVVFLEHTGFEGAATFADFWGGGLVGKTLHVRIRRFPASSVPADGRDTWLFERWAELDDWVCQHAQT
jgi:1-acyl-sn-glycerol-3-phosphate acyltransferase